MPQEHEYNQGQAPLVLEDFLEELDPDRYEDTYRTMIGARIRREVSDRRVISGAGAPSLCAPRQCRDCDRWREVIERWNSALLAGAVVDRAGNAVQPPAICTRCRETIPEDCPVLSNESSAQCDAHQRVCCDCFEIWYGHDCRHYRDPSEGPRLLRVNYDPRCAGCGDCRRCVGFCNQRWAYCCECSDDHYHCVSCGVGEDFDHAGSGDPEYEYCRDCWFGADHTLTRLWRRAKKDAPSCRTCLRESAGCECLVF